MSTRNKRKRTRKPKANVVRSQRRPRRPPQAHAPTPQRDRAEEPEPSTEPQEIPRVEPPGIRWAADDSDAIWWDEVWPFKEETPEQPAVTEPAEEELTDPVEPDTEPDDEADAGWNDDRDAEWDDERDAEWDDEWDDEWDEKGDEEPAPAVPPLWVPPVAPSAGPLWALILVAAAVVAGLLWWATSRGFDEPPIMVHRHAYAAPVRLVPDSSFVRSRILRSGDVVVKHWIRSRRPVQGVHLTAPRVVRGLGPRALSVSGLVVAGDGTRIPVSYPVDPHGVTAYPLPPSKRLYVRYRLSGVVQSSLGPGHRALARITALDVSTSRPLVHTTLTVVGARVLALACTPPGQDVASPCGREMHGTWSTSLGPGQQGSQVMAQLDLSGRLTGS
jgi:hypothetical protein